MAAKQPGLASKVSFVDLLQAGSDPTTECTTNQLSSWVRSLHSDYSVFKDPDDSPWAIKNALGGVRKTLYVVEWSTMEILNKTYQDDTTTWTFLGTL